MSCHDWIHNCYSVSYSMKSAQSSTSFSLLQSSQDRLAEPRSTQFRPRANCCTCKPRDAPIGEDDGTELCMSVPRSAPASFPVFQAAAAAEEEDMKAAWRILYA